jgi:phosphohistidine phosphatase
VPTPPQAGGSRTERLWAAVGGDLGATIPPKADGQRKHRWLSVFQFAPRCCRNLDRVSEENHTLVLLRHAKSAYPDGVADHDRPLAPRGRREAGLAGDWLRANLPAIDAVLCSTATRTRETLAHTAIDAPVRYVDRLYGAAPGTVIDEITLVGDDVAALLLIAHEPAMSQVALGLASGGSANNAAAERISTKFPTSAMAILRFGRSWKDLELGSAELVDFHVPR